VASRIWRSYFYDTRYDAIVDERSLRRRARLGLVTISAAAPEFCWWSRRELGEMWRATGIGDAAKWSSMARLLQVATGGNMPTNTPPNRQTVEREPRGKRSAPEKPRATPPKGAADADAAQREREKRIERFRER